MLPASRFPLPALILSIVAMFFAGCETDYVVSDDLSPAEGPLECIHKDCVTGTNPDVVVVSSEQKTEIPLLTLQTAFFEHYSISTHLQRFNDDGYPAWDAITVKIIDTAYRHYLVPVYKPSSTHIEAVVSILHHLEGGFATIDYLDRDNITSFPAFTTTRLGSKTGDHMSQRYTLEATVFLLSDFDKLLFGAYDMNIVNLLDEEARVALLGKDCKEVINYPVYDCQDIVGGENGDIPLYTDCTFAGWVSEVTGTDGVGCGGGNTPPSGPGTGGTSGGGGSGPTVGTTGPGVIIITIDPNDPNNRCIEDGVGCDEEEEEELLRTDSISVDQTLSTQLPCAQAVLNQFFNSSNNLNTFVQGVFSNPSTPQVNLNFTHGYTGTSHAITNPLNAGGGNGILYALNLEIVFNSQHPGTGQINGCSQDAVYATLIHELFHANIFYFRTRDGFVSGVNPTTGNPFMIVTGNSNDQHEFMATTIVPIMEQMLIDFNPALSNLHGNTGETVAHFLAWAGLQGTPQFSNYMTGNLLTAFTDVNNAASCRDTPANIALYNFINC